MRKINVSEISTTAAHNGVPRKALVKEGDMKSCIQTMNDARVSPGEGFKPHRHEDGEEIYYFLEGKGEMNIENKTLPVVKGDCVIIEQGESHGLTNTSQENLRFLTIRTLSP